MPDPIIPAPDKAPSGLSQSAGWRVGLCVVAGLIAFRALMTFSSTEDLGQRVEDWFFMPSDTSPLLVVLLAAWLLYRRRGRWTALAPGSAPTGVVWLLLGLGIWVFAWAIFAGAANLLPISLCLLVLGTAAGLRGHPGLKLVRLPALFLFFAIPLPGPLLNRVVYDFQIWTAEWAGWLLYLMGSSAFVSGDLIFKPEETFAIIEGCSGMRSVVTLTMLAFLLADLLDRRGLHAALLVVLAPFVAFFMNGLRVLTLIFNPHSEIIAIHNLQGMAILLGGLFLLSLIDSALARLLRAGREGPVPISNPSAEEPSKREIAARPAIRPGLLAGAWVACALVSLVFPTFEEPDSQPTGLRARFAKPLGDWEPSVLEVDRDYLGSVWFKDSIYRRFQGPQESVDLFLAIGEREVRSLSVFSPKTGILESGFRVLDSGERVLSAEGPVARWSFMRSDTRKVLVYYWVISNAGPFRETIQAAFGLQASPFRLHVEPVAIRLVTDVEGPGASGLPEAEKRLDRFYRELEPVLRGLILRMTPSERNEFS